MSHLAPADRLEIDTNGNAKDYSDLPFCNKSSIMPNHDSHEMFLENILSKLTLTDANSDLHFYTSN
jgi:hypothetical protein